MVAPVVRVSSSGCACTKSSRGVSIRFSLPSCLAPKPAGLAYIHLVTRRTVEFGCAIVIIGLLAGVAGAATTLLLRTIEHLTYHYSFGTLLTGVGESSPVRRALGPMVG